MIFKVKRKSLIQLWIWSASGQVFRICVCVYVCTDFTFHQTVNAKKANISVKFQSQFKLSNSKYFTQLLLLHPQQQQKDFFTSSQQNTQFYIHSMLNNTEHRIRYTEVTTSTLRPTSSFIANRSFINTNFSSEVGADDLRKSRIQNLPNYRKLELGSNLEFVVIFQTIEIERLSAEVESNRIKIKDFERQIFNASNYEVQIRQLTEKCFAYESERSKYIEENEKLNLICHQLYMELEEFKRKYSEVDLTLRSKYDAEKARCAGLESEIERWKARYESSNKAKAKELEDMRLLMESQRKSMLDREMRELTSKFHAERGNLEAEIRKLRENLEYRLREIEELKQKAQRQEITIMELRRSQMTITELQNKLATTAAEIQRLNDILGKRQDEINEARQREFRLQQQLKEQQQWEFENKQLRTNLENRVREIQEWRIRSSKLEDQVNRHREVGAMNQQLSSRLGLASKQIQRLNDALRTKLDELEQWRQKFARQEAELGGYRNLKTEMANYESKFTMLTSENDRLNQVLKNRLGEIDEWKNKCNRLEVRINNYGAVEQQNRDLQGQLQNMSRVIEEHRHKITQLDTQIKGHTLTERKCEDLEKRAALLNAEIDRLNNVLKSKVNELEDYRVKYSRLQSTLVQYRNIEAELASYQNSVTMMTEEIEKLANKLREKGIENDKLNSRLHFLEDEVARLKSSESRAAEYEKTINTLNITITEIKRNAQGQNDRARVLDSKVREFENLLYGSNQEKERLSGMLKQRNLEYEELRSKYSRLEQETYMLREVEAGFNQAKSRINLLTNQVERLDRICKELDAAYQKETAISTDLASRVIILSTEIERLNGEGGMKSKDFVQLKEKFYILEKSYREKDSEVLVLTQRITGLENQINFLIAQIQKYLERVTVNENRTKQLEAEIQTYIDYAKRIAILGAEIDRLVGENRGLEEDLAKIRLRYADNINFEQKYENILMSFVLVFAEVESLRTKVAERDVQFQEMRKSILEPIRRV